MKHYRISVLGLGYVGLTTALAFAKLGKVIAYDKDKTRIEELKKAYDKNDEVTAVELKAAPIYYTHLPKDLEEANVYIISVPTLLDNNKQPDLSTLLSVTKMLAQQLKVNDLVIYESSVYPGATDEQCIPLLEKLSGLTCNKDFAVGYSPERINPADKKHCFDKIVKIVSASKLEALQQVAELYQQVVKAGVFPVSSIRVAEAIKIIENIQRDVNISYMNEIAMLLHTLQLDTAEVIAGMQTKWNSLPFKPGLVGGHCLAVNSHYLISKAEEAGYLVELIRTARQVNEKVVKFIVEQIIKKMLSLQMSLPKVRVGILGLSYKENCPDLKDSKVGDLIQELRTYKLTILLHDPLVDSRLVQSNYGLPLSTWKDLKNLDALIIAVAHNAYLELAAKDFKSMLASPGLIMDLKEILNPADFKEGSISLWRF